MKTLIVLFLATFALASAVPTGQQLQYQLHIPDKCSDVLAVKVCDRLERTAKTLKLKSEEVKNAVIDAYKQGKTKAEELAKAAEDILKNKILSKKCEDITSAENCKKIRQLAADAKVQADKLAEWVMKKVAELKTKECEDYLSAANCTQLRDLAGKLKMKAEEVKEMIFEAYLDAKAKGTQQIKEVYNKVKNYVMTTRCEDMFNPDLCVWFRKFAEKTKVALPQIMETAFEVLKKGVAVGKDMVEKVFDIVDYFYDCTDIFDQSSCDRLKRWAAKLKVTAQEVEIAVKKYVRIAIERGTSIYNTIKDFVKNKIYCRFSSNCVNAEDADELMFDVMDTRSIFGEWKNKVVEILNKKFPNLDANVRKVLDDIVAKSKNLYEFMMSLAKQIKANISDKYTELLKKLMVEVTL